MLRIKSKKVRKFNHMYTYMFACENIGLTVSPVAGVRDLSPKQR